MGILGRMLLCSIAIFGNLLVPKMAMAQSVTLDIEGTVAASCVLSGLPNGVQSLGDLKASGSKAFNFTVDCNAPFAYALTSGNLGLKYDNAQEAVVANSSSFETTIPYTVTTSFQTDGASFGDNALSAANLTSANAANCIGVTYSTSCPFAHSGTNAAASGKSANMTINWNGSGSAPRLAGTYSDTLTITVRVK